jgi:hypothetical protein
MQELIPNDDRSFIVDIIQQFKAKLMIDMCLTLGGNPAAMWALIQQVSIIDDAVADCMIEYYGVCRHFDKFHEMNHYGVQYLKLLNANDGDVQPSAKKIKENECGVFVSSFGATSSGHV